MPYPKRAGGMHPRLRGVPALALALAAPAALAARAALAAVAAALAADAAAALTRAAATTCATSLVTREAQRNRLLELHLRRRLPSIQLCRWQPL